MANPTRPVGSGPSASLRPAASGLAALALTVLATFAWTRPPATGAQRARPPGVLPRLAASPHAPRLPSTVADFRLPGTQPGALVDPLGAASDCRACHAGTSFLIEGQDESDEVGFSWAGSMMAHAARDPVFLAALDIANADAEGAGELCLRCHAPRAFLAGRADPPDGSALLPEDRDGIECSFCHRLVDPALPAGHPAPDPDVLGALEALPESPGNGAWVLDPRDRRRGPRNLGDDWTQSPHLTGGFPLASPYHQDAALCGSCHDVSNPLLQWDEARGAYWAGPLDVPFDTDDGARPFPVERTYSEWLHSDFARGEGVDSPTFERTVSTCQDCHMPTAPGAAGQYFGEVVEREDVAAHTLVGGNTWVPRVLLADPATAGELDESTRLALITGTLRAEEMLRRAARLEVARSGATLVVTVVNESGHKLPTGYPEGRRMWLEVEGRDAAGEVVFQSGDWDPATGVLRGSEDEPTEIGAGSGTSSTRDPQLHLWQAKQGLSPEWAEEVGLSPGASFHFVLNNVWLSDNRIPPRGYRFADFRAVDAAPIVAGATDADRYVDGQHWDTARYVMSSRMVSGTVRLRYQTASKAYIDFLADESPTTADPESRGPRLREFWAQTGRSQPVVMAEASFGAVESELEAGLFIPWSIR